MKQPNGYMFYRGPSMINGKPIVAIATNLVRPSENPKTGNMVQVWILADSGQSPQEAAKCGADSAVCGGCPLKPSRSGACYVTLHQAPRAVYDAYKRGNYPWCQPRRLAQLLAGRSVRLGAYGDPAAVPLTVWAELLRDAKSHTGYTHQWRSKKFAGLVGFCQASCDTPEDFRSAALRGWGTFRVRPAGEGLIAVSEASTGFFAREVQCPAAAESPHAATCEECGMCDGASRRHISIVAHGRGANSFPKGD
jgi:hypothetical protein